MLDFNEVGKRIEVRNRQVDCGSDGTMPHIDVVSPLIGQLRDPEYHGENGTVLHTASECLRLADLLQRQAEMLDAREAEAEFDEPQGFAIEAAMPAIEHMASEIGRLRARLARITGGLVVAVLWLSSVVVSVWLSR